MPSTAALYTPLSLCDACYQASWVFPGFSGGGPWEPFCASTFGSAASMESEFANEVSDRHVQHWSHVCDPASHILQVFPDDDTQNCFSCYRKCFFFISVRVVSFIHFVYELLINVAEAVFHAKTLSAEVARSLTLFQLVRHSCIVLH